MSLYNKVCKKCVQERDTCFKEKEDLEEELKQAKEYIDELENQQQKELDNLNFKVDELENKLQNAQEELTLTKQEANLDPLTRLFNRGALDNNLEEMEEVFERYEDNFAVVFIDLDHFKKINDTFGHDAGDMVLKGVANILQENSRKVDVVARYGGEELVVVLPKKDINQAVQYAEKIRSKIQSASFVYDGAKVAVTASLGVSSRRRNSSLSETIKSADAGVYQAKDTGRNKVVSKDVDTKEAPTQTQTNSQQIKMV
jgi:diguanylate cyclase (GGDEF)-like protein